MANGFTHNNMLQYGYKGMSHASNDMELKLKKAKEEIGKLKAIWLCRHKLHLTGKEGHAENVTVRCHRLWYLHAENIQFKVFEVVSSKTCFFVF